MKPLIIANWKCNPTTLKEAKSIFDGVGRRIKNNKNAKVVICPPFIYLTHLINNKYRVEIGAQNCFWEEKGAFTGEVSALMLRDLGCKYVIVGHSERRKYQKESNEIVNKKLRAVLRQGLIPILCIANISQLKGSLKGFSSEDIKKVIVAYEPLFAIGTGKACSPERAKKMKILIKKFLKGKNDILYGGSVNSENARSYIQEGGFQGLLVGGASLKPEEFGRIIKNIDLFQANW